MRKNTEIPKNSDIPENPEIKKSWINEKKFRIQEIKNPEIEKPKKPEFSEFTVA